MLLTFILFLYFIAFINGQCPPDGVASFKDKNICFLFQSNKTAFINAEEICEDLGGHLASVHNSMDNMLLSQQAGNRFTDSDSFDFWIGANDIDNSGTWIWMDESLINYTNWEKGQPTNISGSDCVGIKIQGGKWISDDCFKPKPFVCIVTILLPTTTLPQTLFPQTTTTTTRATLKPINCPTNWVYFPGSGYCYEIYYNQNRANAETFCTSFSGGHLASIHNADENLFVSKLIGSTLSTGENGESWIGAHTEDSEAHSMWSDGTPFDYVYWESGQPDGPGFENCLVFWGSSYGIATFRDARSELVVARFVCKKLPS